nr:HNH endonuclease [Bradyrhizobium symbiodeficiens]
MNDGSHHLLPGRSGKRQDTERSVSLHGACQSRLKAKC